MKKITERITLKITENHIKFGKKESTSLCPIAKAARFAGFLKLIISNDNIHFTYGGFSHCIRLPKKAREFISNFDNGNTVKPFSFIIKVVTYLNSK